MTATMSRIQMTVNLVKADSDSAGLADSNFELGKVLNNIQEL
jgi:hypothetical protein